MSQRPAVAGLLVLLLALLLALLAYQMPYAVSLAIGGDLPTQRRDDDAPYLHGFNAAEPDSDTTWRWWTLEPGYTYRWASSDATITLPGMGTGTWLVRLTASSGRPGDEPTTSTWHLNDTTVDVALPATARVYHLLAAAPNGSLALHMQTPRYAPPDDPRDLGFVVRALHANPTTDAPRWPAPLALAAWLLVLPVAWLLAWLLLGRWQPALLAALASGALLAFLLAVDRLAVLALFFPPPDGPGLFAWLLLGLLLAALLGRLLGLPLPPHWRPVLALVLLAFVLRAGGMLHPHAIFSDHRLNGNNLLELALGKVYFTEGLPAEAGGGQAPYPPGLYLLAAPALTFAPPGIDSRVLIVQLVTALLDSATVALLWGLLRQAGVGQRAALYGAALYLAPPPLMQSFSIGEYANLGGQALALPLVALLALPRRDDARGPPWALLLALLVLLGLLGHLGVAIVVACLLAAAWLLTLTGRGWSLPALTLGGALGAAGAALLYYSAPLFADIFAQRLAGQANPAAAPDTPLHAALLGLLGSLFDPTGRLLPLLVAGGLVGLVLLWRRGPAARPLAATLAAWWGGTLLSFGLLLFARQGVRWQHFLYPALCLGGGVAFAALWRRGRAGRVVGLAAVLAVVAYGIDRWLWQVYDYLH